MANQRNQLVRHANEGVIMMNGKPIADAVGVTVQESGGTDPTHVIGNARAVEHVHNKYSVSVRISRLVFKKSALNDSDVGGASLLDLDTCTIAGLDDVDGQVAFSVIGCTLSDRDRAINANARVQGNLTFQGLATVDGKGTAYVYPNGGRA